MDIIDIKDRFETAKESYEGLFEETLPHIEFDNKRLIEALHEQMSLMVKWEVMTKEFNYIFDSCELICDEEYSDAFRDALRDKYRDVSVSEAKEFAKANKTYLAAKRLLNEVRHHRDECRGILECVHSRKYTLNGMVQTITANVENTII